MSSPMYCSPTFKFIVEGKDFHIHQSLITQHSKPLDRMIHGPMAEAQQGFATLGEVDYGTFSRFVEWLYWGYYHATEPKQLEVAVVAKQSLKELVLNEPAENIAAGQTFNSWGHPVYDDHDNSDWSFGASKKKKSLNSTSFNRSAAKEIFIQRKYTMRNVSRDHPQPRPNNASGEDYSEVFLCQARLYVFADKYDIQGLKILAMEELHAVLAVYTLHKERTGDITSLLRYIYAETAETKEGVDDLRTLMVQYIEIEVGTLIKDDELGELMIQDGGCMLADFLKVMRKRLV